MKFRTTLMFAAMFGVALPASATDLVIATVNNGQMIQMERLTSVFEKQNPDIHVKWVTLEENTLRQRVTTDIATKGRQFDLMTIGMYEVPIWSKLGWLKPIVPDATYDENDLLPPIREGLSYKGKLYAAPFYGESSMMMYRTDLMKKAGLTMPEKPTWNQVREFAAKLNDPKAGVYGICLRGKAGWGENMAWSGLSGFLCSRRWETFPRRRSALATNRATRWESRWSSYAMGWVNRSA